MKERLSMKEILEQLVNYVLVLAMLCSLLPIMGTKVYAESTNTMSVEKFTGNTIVREGTKVVPRENHKLTVYSFPARGSFIEIKCDSWIADDDYMVVNKWGNNSTYDDYIELEGKLVTITYDSNGGSAIEPTTDVIAIPKELPIPIKEGYTFGGWYLSDTFLGAKVSSGQKIYRDVTLYAKWIKNLSEEQVIDKVKVEIEVPEPEQSLASTCTITEGAEGIESYEIVWHKFPATNCEVGEKVEYDQAYWLFIYLTPKEGYRFAEQNTGEAYINGQRTAGWWSKENGKICININQFAWTRAENPKADLESGTYTENKILTLSAAQELEDIYYTTDGSEPTIESTKYTNPISITGEEGKVKTIVIKARVIRQYRNDIMSDICTFTYTIDLTGSAPVKDYTITALTSGGGSISPSGSIKVTEGQEQTFTITPMEGYEIDTVKVDGIAVTASSSYTFTGVMANHSIEVTFKKQLREIDPYDLKVGDTIFKGDILDENKMIVICRTCHQIWILNAGEKEYGVGDRKRSQVNSLPEHSGHNVGYSGFNWYSTSEDSIAFEGGVPYTVVENECVRCKITYDTNGGSKIEEAVEQVKLPKEFPIPTKPGYVFDGWYMDRYFTTAATPEMKLVKDTTLYAKWTEEHIHTRHLTKVEAKAATCTEKGNKAYYKCSCEQLFADKDAQKEITLAEVEIEAKGHEYESLYDETQHWKKCKNCDAVTEKIAHEYETEYTKDAKYHWKKCKNCDAVTEKQEHTSSGEATEENAETCTVCGYVIHEKLQKESNDSSMQWQTLNKAKLVTEKAFADYKAGKESDKSDIANVVAQALKENSLSNVAYEIISYEKTEPTSATEGKISGIVSLAIGGCSTQVPFNYVIAKVEELQKPAQITGKGAQTTDGQIKISWIKADGADGYRIYASVCDGESNYKLIKDTKDLTGAIKNLNNKKSYKFYVVAYKNVDGKKVRICKSMIYHVVLSDNKYTNVKAIKVAKTSYTLNVGDKQKLNAKSVKQEKNKKLLTHAQEFRYSSSDTTVATVSKTGEITAKQSGSCIIYVVANNGVMKKIKVNVA